MDKFDLGGKETVFLDSSKDKFKSILDGQGMIIPDYHELFG